MASGILQGAHDIVLNNPQLNDYTSHSTTITQINEKKGRGLKLLLRESMLNAFHDSSARDPPPRCHPGTREDFIEEITSWGRGTSHHGQRILWMHGPAGVGKSAVAQSFAERLAEENKLGATLFLSRSNGRDDSQKLFTSLSYQIATKFPPYGDMLDRDILNDPTLLKKSRTQQFRELFVRPWQDLAVRKGMDERVIIIDGLDECAEIDAQCDIIQIIATSVQDGTTLFRWAFFSRPETHIVASFTSSYILPVSTHLELPVCRETDREICRYLTDEFWKIRERNKLPTSWPSKRDIESLVQLCAGLFIYAAALIRFVGERNSLGPEDQLLAILALATSAKRKGGSGHPLAELDLFYTLIMHRIPSKHLPVIQKILLLRSISERSISIPANALGLSEAQVRNAFGSLHSVLELGYGDYPKIKFYHASFPDFLQDPERSKEFCIYSSYLEVTRLELLERLNWVHSQSVGGSLCIDLTWPHTHIHSMIIYQDWIHYLFRLCQSGHPLESSVAAALVNFQFRMILSLWHNPYFNPVFLSPERLRENMPVEFRNKIIRLNNTLWLKYRKPPRADPRRLYILGYGKHKVICWSSSASDHWNLAPYPSMSEFLLKD